MKVTPYFSQINQKIQNIRNIPFVSFSGMSSTASLDPLTVDTLELNPIEVKKAKAKNVYDRFHKFDIKSYQSLSEDEIKLLQDSYEYYTKSAAGSASVIGVNLKNYLDELYGKDKYAFISIGTSPAPIARALEFCGIETKYLPISDLKNLVAFRDQEQNEKMIRTFLAPDFDNYLRFMDEQGLSKEKMDNSDKKFIFTDYTYSGKTLKAFKYLLEECFDIKLPNVEFVSINRLLDKSIPEGDGRLEFYVNDFLKKYMKDCQAEKYGGIPHLPIEVIDTVETCKEYSNDTAKQFNFLLIDYLNEQGLLKDNPLNESAL